MHELGITRDILAIVLRYAQANNVTSVRAIDLEIGGLSDLEGEWIQRYFSRLSAGTPAEDAVIRVEKLPVVFTCNSCSTVFTASFAGSAPIICTSCQSGDVTLISGSEYRIKSMEAL